MLQIMAGSHMTAAEIAQNRSLVFAALGRAGAAAAKTAAGAGIDWACDLARHDRLPASRLFIVGVSNRNGLQKPLGLGMRRVRIDIAHVSDLNQRT